MIDSSISSQLVQFILATIDSVAQVEAILLCREGRGTKWTSGELAGRLYISDAEAAELLAQLSKMQILEAAPGEPAHYVYRPATPEMSSLIDQLASTYRRQLVPITKLIHSKAKTRIQEFADAFRIRKEES